MVQGCQTCLRVIKDPSEGLYIKNFDSSLDAIPLKEKLMDCVPELVLDSVDNAVLCNSCVANLMVAYRFKQTCLETQEKIHGFLQQLPVSDEMDIGKIAVHYQRLEIIAQGGDPTLADPSSSKIKRVKMPYNCRLCPFSCLDNCVIRQHEILHRTESPPYRCDQCPFCFPTAELLLDHLANHSNERPYSCSLCNFATSIHNDLKEHGWVHRKAFQCNICWKRFAQSNDLDAHMEIHNYEQETRRFQCGWCEFRCDSLQTLNAHSDTNHKNFYNCNTCTATCRTYLGLMEHMKRVHKNFTGAPEEIDVIEKINYHLNDVIIEPPNAPSSLERHDLQCCKRESCECRCKQIVDSPLGSDVVNSTPTAVHSVISISQNPEPKLVTPTNIKEPLGKRLTYRQRKNMRRVRVFMDGNFVKMKRAEAIGLGLWTEIIPDQ